MQPFGISVCDLNSHFVGGSLVSDVHVDSGSGRVTGVTTRNREGQETRHAADAVVFAIGITGVSIKC